MDHGSEQLGRGHRDVHPLLILSNRNRRHRLPDRARVPVRCAPSLVHLAASPARAAAHPSLGAPGEDRSYAKRIFLIYDGIHYDCVVERGPEERRAFDRDDSEALEGATAIGAEANRARRFTDLAAFALRCLVCGQGLTGAADAQAHAAATGHTNFAEK